MAPHKLPQRQERPSDLPSRVSITVAVIPTEPARRIGKLRARLARPPSSLVAGVALAAVMACAVVAAPLLQTGRTNAVTRRAAATPRADAVAVAAAFGYPQRCLSVAIAADDPDYASAHVDRRGACANYRGYVNASFHRVDGIWRLVLDEGQLFVANGRLSPRGVGSSGAGATSGYPLDCVSVAVALHDPRFGRAEFDRKLPCVRDHR